MRFRVYPENRSLYWTVRVFPTLLAMRRAHARYRGVVNKRIDDGSKLGAARKAKGLVAATTMVSFRKGRHARTQMSMGEVFLCKKYLGGGLVAHEATHAARYYFSRLKVPIEPESMDERLAHVVGNIVAQIGQRVWA